MVDCNSCLFGKVSLTKREYQEYTVPPSDDQPRRLELSWAVLGSLPKSKTKTYDRPHAFIGLQTLYVASQDFRGITKINRNSISFQSLSGTPCEMWEAKSVQNMNKKYEKGNKGVVGLIWRYCNPLAITFLKRYHMYRMMFTKVQQWPTWDPSRIYCFYLTLWF